MMEFQNRSYTKKELALMYFSDSTPHTAVKHLMAWIALCTPLVQRLREMGYQKSNKAFTPKQVKSIVDFLGEP